MRLIQSRMAAIGISLGLAAVALWLADGRMALLVLLAGLAVYLLKPDLQAAPADTDNPAQKQMLAELARLNQESVSSLQQQMIKIADEKRQIAALTAHATHRLADSFGGISQQAARADSLLHSLSDNDEQDPATTRQVVSSASDATQSLANLVSQAVTALQFEDMCKQLSQHIDKRIETVNQLILLIDALQQAQLQPEQLARCRQRLEQLRQTAAALQPDIAATRHKSVSQHNLDSGDIELF